MLREGTFCDGGRFLRKETLCMLGRFVLGTFPWQAFRVSCVRPCSERNAIYSTVLNETCSTVDRYVTYSELIIEFF